MRERLKYFLGPVMVLVLLLSVPVKAEEVGAQGINLRESENTESEESIELKETHEESALEKVPEETQNKEAVKDKSRQPVLYRSDLDIFYRGDETVSNQWVDLYGKRYFADPDGHPYRSRIIRFGPEKSYYMASDGALMTGFFESSLGLHYAYESGDNKGLILKNNAWVKVGEGRIFPNAQGLLYRKQFISFGPNKRFYMRKDGLCLAGPVEADGTVYDLDENGMLIQRAHPYTFEGKEYFANEKGMPYRDRFITFGPKKARLCGKDGSIQKGMVKHGGTVYRIDEDGYLVKKSSSYTFEGRKYFADPNGMPYRNRIINFGPGKAYFMGSDGALTTGFINSGNKTYLADNDSGKLLINKGLLDIDGKRYFSNSWDYALHSGWLDLDGERYYFDPKAERPWRLESCDRIIDGVSYRFDEKGRSKKLAIYSEPGEWTYDGDSIYGPAISTRRVGKNHTIISLTHQYMWIFNDGQIAYETPVITGRPDMPTVRGHFVVQGKERNRILRGPDYESPVKYWVPFYYAYGIHDASWQRSRNFYKNSKAYTWTGSHGCVNVKPWVMSEIYPLFIRGTAVTVY